MDEPYLLLVEENEDDVFLTLRNLERHDFDLPVLVVADIREALAYLETVPRLPLAVLASYKMARRNGLEFIDELRQDERTRKLPALLLTGSASERDHLCGSECRSSADACLVKPIESQELSRSLLRLGVVEPLPA